MRELEIDGIETINLAKRHEEVFQSGNSDPIVLPAGSQALLLLRHLRDEEIAALLGISKTLAERIAEILGSSRAIPSLKLRTERASIGVQSNIWLRETVRRHDEKNTHTI